MNTSCPNCGTKTLEGAAYCIVCGTPVDGDGTPRQVQRTQHTAPDSEMSASTTSVAEVHKPTPGELTEPTPNEDASSREDGVQPYGMARVLREVFGDIAHSFVWAEQKTVEPFAAWLSRLAILDILEYLGKLAILVVVVYWIWQIPDRDRQEHYEAWRVINSAAGQEGTGGRIDALEDLYQDKQSLDGLTAPEANLARVDLHEEGEDGAQIENATLGQVNLTKANLYAADLSGADLREAKLREADLGGRADLRRADLRDADLTKAKLAEADFSNGVEVGQAANLDEVVLDKAKLNGADLRGVSLEDASLWKAKLQGAKLQGANLTRAGLSGAALQGASLKGAIFDGAYIYGANLEGTNVNYGQLEKALGDDETKIPDDLERPSSWEEEEIPFPKNYSLDPENGREYTGVFQPTISVDVVKSGWISAEAETENYLELGRGSQAITFLNTDEVYDPQNASEDHVTPVPENLVRWIEKHPHLTIDSKKNVSVGGVRGVRLDVTAATTPEYYPMACAGPCVALFRSSDEASFWVYWKKSTRYYILDFGYETVVIWISDSAPDATREAREVLDSMRFTDYAVATGQIFSGGFKPSLSFTVADQGWWMSGASPDYWTLSREISGVNDGYLNFINVDEVYDPQHPSDETISSAPKDLVAWFEKHPRLEIVGKPEQVNVGNARGVQLEVLVSSAAEDFCGECVPLFPTSGDYYWLDREFKTQLTILQVGGETVVISAESPTGEFEDFRQKADEVISSVKWNG